MKRIYSVILTAFMIFGLAACGSGNQQKNEEGFVPKLDKSTACKISIVGTYSNFEALEAEFDRFNEYYPNVEMSYTKIDEYNSAIETVLNGNDAPNIFFSFSWMIGNPAYDGVFDHMENLSDESLGLNLDCIRPGLISRDEKGRMLMVPVFSTSYGMLINNDLFAQEELKVPTNLQELYDVCASFKEKGYESPMMGYSKDSSGCLMNTVAYPVFAGTLQEHPEMVALANGCDPAAGEYMRTSLETLTQLIDKGCINLEKCAEISDNYTEVILRFYEGDVPMMICTGDTVSGTKKRESQSEAFTAHPFTYTFAPLPTTDKGGYFLDSPSVQFSVNSSCDNLDMTNEFMRFLISKTELNEMASIKRLITPTNDLSFDKVYAPVADTAPELIISPAELGIEDTLAVQIRLASFKVGTGEMTIDEAVAAYGSLE
ncbi:MAG: carbohydrate ABC transporter substrate-binding protein [Clostridia bacterium]|nr:carbohydrate ABC transporter substrate-binding protein [Clostridia bacterium]MBR5720946.1 carbohydrate ABC transporter substrate-binding protein [Clostridia bacterium]